ncbi:pentraxin-related protein PTX3 [Nerophis lumbriciformis]|uniref:pentraxin-related protein PTX3 n=1 Tax=Nerophis lumbriciformis TaxID=546530 RepID=UPI002ADFC5B4|nr:pentraxin-related protein PTX3-like [Nerophis lumbriciformis]
MLHRGLALALGVWSACVCLTLAYEDDIEVNYADTYYNEITEDETPTTTPSAAPCNAPDLTKWDKIFSMLENSQMRENMLLQYADDIVKVEMGSLREEILRFVAQYGGSCGVAVETAGRKMALQLEAKLRESLDRLKFGAHASGPVEGNAVGNPNTLEATLQQLLSATRTQATRLAKMETSCFINAGPVKAASQHPDVGGAGHREQEVTSQDKALEGVLSVLQQTKMELQEVLRSSRLRRLPAGCEMALLFPMRSPWIYTSVIPEVPLSLSSFTLCLWVKPVAVANKTVLFSYGTRRNPYEIQLLLSHTSALLTIGGETHLVEARGVVKPDGPPEWLHLCGAWSSQQGLASLWASGKKVASTPGVAEGHVLPNGGSLQLGQERNGKVGYEERFDLKMAFAGSMTGVNVWDKVLPEEKISQLALQDGQGCQHKGNIIGWGVTELVPHGGAQFIN